MKCHLFKIMSKCWSDRPEDRPTFLALERAFKFLIPDNDLTLMNTAVTNERMTYQGSEAHHEIPGTFNADSSRFVSYKVCYLGVYRLCLHGRDKKTEALYSWIGCVID